MACLILDIIFVVAHKLQDKSTSLSHTLFKVLEGFFTVTLLTVTMETLHGQTLQAHVTGQVISPGIACK